MHRRLDSASVPSALASMVPSAPLTLYIMGRRGRRRKMKDDDRLLPQGPLHMHAMMSQYDAMVLDFTRVRESPPWLRHGGVCVRGLRHAWACHAWRITGYPLGGRRAFPAITVNLACRQTDPESLVPLYGVTSARPAARPALLYFSTVTERISVLPLHGFQYCSCNTVILSGLPAPCYTIGSAHVHGRQSNRKASAGFVLARGRHIIGMMLMSCCELSCAKPHL